jgi:hypothetical protein
MPVLTWASGVTADTFVLLAASLSHGGGGARLRINSKNTHTTCYLTGNLSWQWWYARAFCLQVACSRASQSSKRAGWLKTLWPATSNEGSGMMQDWFNKIVQDTWQDLGSLWGNTKHYPKARPHSATRAKRRSPCCFECHLFELNWAQTITNVWLMSTRLPRVSRSTQMGLDSIVEATVRLSTWAFIPLYQ